MRLFPRFFHFFFIRALPTEEMEKEHAHINGGGCNKLATCLLSSSFCLENVHLSSFFCVCTRALHMCFHSYMCKDLARSSHPPQTMLAAQAHLVPLFCRSLTPSSILFPLMHSLATRLSLRPRATVTPPPWSSSWRQARTRTRRTR